MIDSVGENTFPSTLSLYLSLAFVIWSFMCIFINLRDFFPRMCLRKFEIHAPCYVLPTFSSLPHKPPLTTCRFFFSSVTIVFTSP